MTIDAILTESFPGQQWTLRAERGATPEEQYAGLEWIGPAKKPTLEEILAAELTDEQRVKRAEDAHPERTAIVKSAAVALATNAAFIVDTSRTNAKTLAQIIELTRQNSAIIRRLAQL